MLWTNELTVAILENHPQFVTLKVTGVNGSWFYMTAVYASPSRSARDILWDVLHSQANELDGLAEQTNWMVHGSQEAILNPHSNHLRGKVAPLDEIGFVLNFRPRKR